MASRSWSTLFRVMACCLVVPSHYLDQYWPIRLLHKEYPSYWSRKLAKKQQHSILTEACELKVLTPDVPVDRRVPLDSERMRMVTSHNDECLVLIGEVQRLLYRVRQIGHLVDCLPGKRGVVSVVNATTCWNREGVNSWGAPREGGLVVVVGKQKHTMNIAPDLK